MSGVANRRGKAAAARPANRAAVTAGVVPTHTSVHGICTPSSSRIATSRTLQHGGWLARRSDSPTRCSKSADANQPKCSGPRTSPSRRSSSLRTMTASSPPLHRRPTRRGRYRPAPRSSDRDPSFSASLEGSEPQPPICLSSLMLGLEIISIPSIQPTLESVPPADFRQLQWIMNAYTIAMCATLC